MTADVIALRPFFSAGDLTALYRKYPSGSVYRGRFTVSFATGDARGRIVSLERDRTWVLWCSGTVIATGRSLAEVLPACNGPAASGTADCTSGVST